MAVSQDAGIWESKSAFFDWGHDHTGGDQGAIIDLTDNLVFNGSFEYDMSMSGGLALPDFWQASGHIDYEIYPSGHMGAQSLKMENPLGTSIPLGAHCFYQDIPPPSGKAHGPAPSGADFADRTLTMGCWVKTDSTAYTILGTGSVWLGYNDGSDHWWDEVILTNNWQWLRWTFICSPNTEAVRVMFYPNGPVLLDNIQLAIGKRLISEQVLKSESDRELWRNINVMFTCGISGGMHYGEAMHWIDNTSGMIEHPTNWGQGKIVGITCANVPASGLWAGGCNQGVTTLKVIYPVTASEPLTCAAHDDYPGYSIAASQVSEAAGSDYTGWDLNEYAIAMESKEGTGPGIVTAFVQCNVAWEANSSYRSAALMGGFAPEYPNTVTGKLIAGSGMNGNLTDYNDSSDPVLTVFDASGYYPYDQGSHNAYKWNRKAAIRKNREFIFDASGNAEMRGDASGTFIFGNMGDDEHTPRKDMNIWEISNEVYQEGLVIGRLGKVWGDHIERNPLKIVLGSIYEDEEVESVALALDASGYQTLPSGYVVSGALGDLYEWPPKWPDDWDYLLSGSVFPSGWNDDIDIGFDLRNGWAYSYGSGRIDSAHTSAITLMSGYVDANGDYVYLISSDDYVATSGSMAQGVKDVFLNISGAVTWSSGYFDWTMPSGWVTPGPSGYFWIRNKYMAPDEWQSPWGLPFVPSGVGLTAISGTFRAESFPYTSIVTRLMVPDDFQSWASGESYLYNKIELQEEYYDSSGNLPASWWVSGYMVSGYFDTVGPFYDPSGILDPSGYERLRVASGYESCGLSLYVYDTSGTLAYSGIDVRSLESQRAWTKTFFVIPNTTETTIDVSGIVGSGCLIHAPSGVACGGTLPDCSGALSDVSGVTGHETLYDYRWTPKDWFTVKIIMESHNNTSAYAGEMGIFYRNYSY